MPTETIHPITFPSDPYKQARYELMIEDGQSTKYIRGLINAQWVGHGDIPVSGWTAYDNWTINYTSADLTHEHLYSNVMAITPDGSYSAGDTLYWRIVVCDNVDSEVGDTGCIDGQSTAWPYMSFASMPIEYALNPTN